MDFSIVIPVYNCANYLVENLQSVTGQDFPDDRYEIICIDDGSTDGSSEILDGLATEYKSLRVIHQINSGVSAARNIGIKEAQGDYIWFIDSDDLIVPNSLSIISKHLNYKPDRIRFRAWPCYEDITIEKCIEIQTADETPSYDYQNKVVWNCVLKKTFLLEKDIWFSTKMSYAEDEVFMASVLTKSPSNIELKDIIYYHRQNPSSLMAQHDAAHENMRIVSTIEASKRLRALSEEKSQYQGTIRKQFGNMVLNALSRIQNQPKELEKRYLSEMHSYGLFPCSIPKNCTERNIFTKRNNSNLYYFLYCRLNTRWGYETMKMLKKTAAVWRKMAKRSN